MPPPSTVPDFLALVRRSGVTEEALLTAALPHVEAAEPMPLAEGLIRCGVLTHFQAEQLLRGKTRGFTIGNYKVLERLGSGGMAVVYLCEHQATRRRVAIKVLPSAKTEDVATLKRFYREARAGTALDHENIVRVHGISQEGSRHFMVMEYVAGALLGSLVKQNGPLHPLRACHYIRQAAAGLQHLHETGLVHRDIKPDNLILDRTGIVKILDLGLARFNQGSDEVLTKGILGTPDYLAPEQTLDSHLVDIRADVYSLGGTFYYLLTGQAPFGEGTTAQKLHWHKTRIPDPVRTLRPDVPETLSQMIARMMAKQPADRYPTPQAIANALIPWTTVPIAPPSEEEMPYLSPAAGGSSTAAIILNATPPETSDPLLQITPGPTQSSSVVKTAERKKEDEEPVDPMAKAFSAADLMRGMFG